MNKPIEKEEHIGLFFSDDASFSNVNPIYQDAYAMFLRYHKRQLNNLEFGIGTNANLNKMNKEKYGGGLFASMLEINNQSTDETLFVSIPHDEESQEEIKSPDSFQKEVSLHIRKNIEHFQKMWLDSLKEQNFQYVQSRKELIQLDRFNFNIQETKMALYSVHGTKVYKSASSKQDVPLVQFHSRQKVEFFNN